MRRRYIPDDAPVLEKPTRGDIFERITATIVDAIEAGEDGKGWRAPWHQNVGPTSNVMPINLVSRKHYRGMNTLILWCAALERGYTEPVWATMKQWNEAGARVRKGEHATMITYWKFEKGRPATEDDEGEKGWAMMRGYFVFNVAQIEDYEPKQPRKPTRELSEAERLTNTEQFFAACKITTMHGGNRAYYIPSMDAVHMPPYKAFKTRDNYYSTLAHEYTHATGHKSRLDRQLGNQFGNDAYAFEELIAELGAAFTCAHLGIFSEPRPDHAQYIAHWLRRLKEDKRAIFRAASKAQAALDWMEEQQ